LAAVAVVVALSSAVAARYQHPAWLITWEWVVLLITYCLVRQLPRRPGETRRLLAAVVASGISVSAYGLYQYRVELPRLRENLLASPERMREGLAREGVRLEAGDPQLVAWRKRIEAN